MRAQSSPGQGPSIRRAELVRVLSPRASASRRAGSMVTTQALRPRRAPSRAKAAEMVVLPTPPDPQHTTIDRSSTRSEMDGRPAGTVTTPAGSVTTPPPAPRPGPSPGPGRSP